MDRFPWYLRVRVTGPGTVRVFTRKHAFDAGAPLDFDAESPYVTALEYALGALGAEIAGGFAERARRRRLQVEHVEAAVQGELNDPLVPLGVIGATGHPGIERISIKLYVSSPEAEAVLREVWAELLETSSLLWTFRKATQVDLVLQVAL